jgi:hypothetical protein
MVLVTKTWEESCYDDDGEPLVEEDGFEFVDEPMTFRCLVDELRELGAGKMPSCWPAKGGTFEWVMSEPHMDTTGTWRTTSLHYAQKNLPRSAKYWRWAFIHAGLIKGASK